ncbi:diguanylate cyclase domain-containing protein (plasmid) [Pseudoalteromonas espejiana]
MPNRRYFFYERLQALVSKPNQKFTLIFIDLDGFKEVNDSLGHDFGDLLLHEVAIRLQKCISQYDTVARLGGDEFTLILENTDNPTEVIKTVENVMDNLTKPITIKMKE